MRLRIRLAWVLRDGYPVYETRSCLYVPADSQEMFNRKLLHAKFTPIWYCSIEMTRFILTMYNGFTMIISSCPLSFTLLMNRLGRVSLQIECELNNLMLSFRIRRKRNFKNFCFYLNYSVSNLLKSFFIFSCKTIVFWKVQLKHYKYHSIYYCTRKI